MEALDKLGSVITYEAKTILGVIGIILGFIIWAMAPYIGLINILFLIIPAILLVIPSETVKNSKILGIIFIVLLLIIIFSLSGSYNYIPGDLYTGVAGAYAAMETAITLQIILSIYCLFCAFLLIIPSQHKHTKVTTANTVITNKTKNKYDKFGSECGEGLYTNSKFCPSCGTKVDESED